MVSKSLEPIQVSRVKKTLDLPHCINAVDLTEEQMEACCGGTKGVLFWFTNGPISISGGIGRQEEFQAELSSLRGRVE